MSRPVNMPPHLRWVSPKVAARMLNVDKRTLRRWEKQGLLVVTRTPQGHRRYRVDHLEQAMATRTAW